MKLRTQIQQVGTKDGTITDKEAANIKIYLDFISEETAIVTKLTKTKRDLMGEFFFLFFKEKDPK